MLFCVTHIPVRLIVILILCVSYKPVVGWVGHLSIMTFILMPRTVTIYVLLLLLFNTNRRHETLINGTHSHIDSVLFCQSPQSCLTEPFVCLTEFHLGLTEPPKNVKKKNLQKLLVLINFF